MGHHGGVPVADDPGRVLVAGDTHGNAKWCAFLGVAAQHWDCPVVLQLGDFGYWGEVLTTGAQARGILGLVIDGGVRDIVPIETLGFPVFASTIALRGASKNQAGAVNVPIRCGGASVVRGDWIVGDVDGVVAVPGADVATVIAAGEARAGKEQGFFTALRDGSTTVELLDLDTSPVKLTLQPD